MKNPRFLRLLDSVWLLVLAVYVLAGMMLASFHGDEAMQIYMSSDYATAFIDKEPQRLITSPPYDVDSDPQLRIINGSVNRYAIGLSWHLAGMTTADLAPRPGWDWGLDYQTNVDTDHLPSDALLAAGRLPSTIFLILSSFVMFGIGWQFGRRPLAYLASALYTINPVILLNGRRAMMEGSMLFFGLLTILIAVIISRKREQGGGGLWGWWLALILACGLAVVSKHTGIVFVLAALGWIFVAELFRRRWQPLLVTSVKLLVSAVLIVAIFIALSPALWNDPPNRFQDLITARALLLEDQIGPNPPMTVAERIASIFFQPFMAPAAHFELTQWSTFEPIMLQVHRYMASPLSGLQFGITLGLPLTILAISGLVMLFIPRLRPAAMSWAQVAGMLIWLLGTVAMLMANPLPWQRYYLPLIPLVTLLAGIGLIGILRAFSLKRRQQDEIPLVTPGVRAQTE